jgi:hypothetical protein
MIRCSSCGKAIDKVPHWLEGAKAVFVCNNCPNRTAKNIAFVTLEPEPKAAAAVEEPDPEDLAAESEDVL